MAILLNATEKLDERELQETREGWRGKRVYIITSGELNVAVFGNLTGTPTGLPKKGDKWHTVDAPLLVCVGRRFRREGGQDTDTVNKTGGYTLCEVSYETLGLHGSLPPPSSGISFTRLAPSTSNIQAYYGVNPDTGQADLAAGTLANGRGVSVDVGVLAMEVFSPLAKNDSLPLARVNTLHTRQQTNDAAIDLPPLLGQTQGLTFAADQLRMAGFGVDDPDETGWRFVRYQLRAALDHKQRWFVEGPDGETTGELREAFVYTRGDFSGLW